MLSSGCTYGIRAVVFLAAQEAGGFVPVRRIAEALTISPHFLAKVLHGLADARLVDTYRGPNGGARLSRPATDITVRDIVLALDGPGLFRQCLLGLPGCGDAMPCPVHDEWAVVRSRIERTLAERSVRDLAEGFRRGDQRLSAIP